MKANQAQAVLWHASPAAKALRAEKNPWRPSWRMGRLFNFDLGWVSPSLFSQLQRRNLPPLSRCLPPLQGAQIL